MLKINKVNKARLLFWCIIIAIIVYVIADIDRQRSGQADVGAEESLNGKDFKVIGNKIVEIEYKTEEQFLEKHRKKLERDRKEKQEEEEKRLVRVEKETKRRAEVAAKIKKEQEETKRRAEAAEKIKKEQEERTRLANIEVEKKKSAETQVVAKAEQPSRGGSKGRSLGTFQATAYCGCSTCNGKYVGQPTASGTQMQQGRTIAVDPNVIPLGSRVSVNGHVYIAEDTGSAIKGKIIDIYHGSHSSALKFGRQSVTVRILN